MRIKILAIFAFLFAANVVSAQNATADKWPALKEFHTVISQTFHPAEEGNFSPVKARSEELMNKGAAFLKGNVPAEFRTNSILASAEKLQLKTKILHKMVVAKASDGEIMAALTQVHRRFSRHCRPMLPLIPGSLFPSNSKIV